MKKLILLALVLAPLGASANGWALLSMESDGNTVMGGAFSMDGEKVALYSKQFCAEKARDAVMGAYSYATQFEYHGGGVFSVSGVPGRVVCLPSSATKGFDMNGVKGFDMYVKEENRQYGDAVMGVFFADFGDRIDPMITSDRIAKYNIFPLDGDAEGLGKNMDAELEDFIVARQKTSFDCGASDLGAADVIVCHDKKLAFYDLRLKELIDQAKAKDAKRFQDVEQDFDDAKREIFYPAGLEKLYQEKINQLSKRLQAV